MALDLGVSQIRSVRDYSVIGNIEQMAEFFAAISACDVDSAHLCAFRDIVFLSQLTVVFRSH